MWLLQVLIGSDKLGQDKMAELAKQMLIAKLKLRDSSHSQVLTLSGKCQDCRKDNVDYVTNEFYEGQIDWMS